MLRSRILFVSSKNSPPTSNSTTAIAQAAALAAAAAVSSSSSSHSSKSISSSSISPQDNSNSNIRHSHISSSSNSNRELKRLLDEGEINTFCSFIRDGNRAIVTSSNYSEQQHHQQQEQNFTAPSSFSGYYYATTSLSKLLFEEPPEHSRQATQSMKRMMRRSVNIALNLENNVDADSDHLDGEPEIVKSPSGGSDRNSSGKFLSSSKQQHHHHHHQQISAASWTVLANIAVSQGMWTRAIQVFDKMIHHGKHPSPHAVAQTLRPANIDLVRKWASRNKTQIDIVTGMRVLVEYSNNWAAALQFAISEEQQFCGSPSKRGASEMFSLGALIPYLANGGKWSTAATVLSNALAQGSLVTDSLVRMILRSTAQKRTWVSCLALTSQLTKCYAIQPSALVAGNERDAKDLQSTLRAVASVCPDWKSACQMVTVCRDAGARVEEFVIGSAMEKCQLAGLWQQSSKLMQVALEEEMMNSSNNNNNNSSKQVNNNNNNVTELAAKRLVEVFRTQSQCEGALKAVSWMSKADSAATAAGLLTTIELCAKTGHWKVAAELGSKVFASKKQSEEQQQQLSDHHQIISTTPNSPATTTYIALIDVLSSAGRWCEAAQAFTEMCGDSTIIHETSALTCANETVLEACGNEQLWEAALTFFEKALQWEPRVVLPVGSYETVVKTCLAAARWREAVEVLRLQRRNGVVLEAAHFRAGLWATALIASASSSSSSDNNNNKKRRESNQIQEISTNETIISPSTTTTFTQQKTMPSWISCLKFYSLIPVFRRTASDTEVVVRLASSLRNHNNNHDKRKDDETSEVITKALYAIHRKINLGSKKKSVRHR